MIEFNRQVPVGREDLYVSEAIKNSHLGAGGAFTARCEELLGTLLGARVLLTTSATAALEIACLLLELREGDEVILPSFTFVSTANAICLRGAHPRFVDIRSDTLNLDPDGVVSAITPRTRAIIPVHYAGVAADPDRIGAIAEAHGLPVIEDAAHGLGARFRGKPLGTFGNMAAFSFHETKNIGCGEGGALVVNDAFFIERAEILRDKGTNRAAFRDGRVDKYTWVGLGSSYGLSDLSAAYLLGQLEALEQVNAARRRICDIYRRGLDALAKRGVFRLPFIPVDCESNGHIFHIVMPSQSARDRMILGLRQMGVEAVFHYVPLHSSPMGIKMGYRAGDLPVTEEISRRLVRLPVYASLQEYEALHVIEAVKACVTNGCEA